MTDFEQSYPAGAAHAASELDDYVPLSWWESAEQQLGDIAAEIIVGLMVTAAIVSGVMAVLV